MVNTMEKFKLPLLFFLNLLVELVNRIKIYILMASILKNSARPFWRKYISVKNGRGANLKIQIRNFGTFWFSTIKKYFEPYMRNQI